MLFDAIVIGSGLGGCAAAAALTSGGKKVIILERMDFIGGRCSSTFKDGFRLDIGCHLLFGCEFGTFERAAASVGKAGVLKFYHPRRFRVINQDTTFDFDGEQVVLDNERSSTIRINAAELTRDMLNMFPPQLLSMGMSMISRILPAAGELFAPLADHFDDVTMQELIGDYFDWPKIKDFIECFQLAGFCTPSWVTSSSELIRTALQILDYFKPGMNPFDLMGYPIGGLTAIPTTICEGIVEMGGEVRTGANVVKILDDGIKVIGVELESGEVINAPLIISNAGIKETVADLVGEEKFEPEYAKRIRELISGVSAFTFRAQMDRNITDLECGFYLPDGGAEKYFRKVWDELEIPDIPPQIMFSVPSNMDPTACPEGKQLILGVGPSMVNAKGEFSKLEPLVQESLNSLIPGFKDHLVSFDMTTPKTYQAFGELDAPVIGIAQSVGQVGASRPSSVSPLKGLYYCGGEAGKFISGIGCDLAAKSGFACGNYILQNS